MLKKNTEIFEFDPLSPDHEKYLIPLFHRISDFARDRAKMKTYQAFTRVFKSRLVTADPNTLAILVVHDEKLVGHSLFTVEDNDGERVLYVHQVDVEPGFPRAIDIFVSFSHTWAMKNNLTKLVMEVPLDFHPMEIWSKAYRRYGFVPVSYTVERTVLPGKVG